jgi:hypothetical protein
VAGVRLPFDDTEVAQRALATRGTPGVDPQVVRPQDTEGQP